MKKNYLKSLILLGRIGRTVILLCGLLILIGTSIALIFGSGGEVDWSGESVSVEEEVNEDGSITQTENVNETSFFLKSGSPFSFHSTHATIYSIYQMIVVVALLVVGIFLYQVFNFFAKGKVFDRSVGKKVLLVGLCCFPLCFEYYLEETRLVYTEDEVPEVVPAIGGHRDPRATASETVSYSYGVSPGIAICGLFIMALGLAIRYGALIEEDNQLTV